MVGDMGCVCPLPKGKVPCVGVAFTSHFECLWHFFPCNTTQDQTPTAFHPLNTNPFIHSYHGGHAPVIFRKRN